jgi:outer membrane protein assembly factor BamB
MRRISQILMLLTAFAVLVVSPANSADNDKNWPQWRGPSETGVAPNSDPAIEWSETKNVKWKVALPGKGHSTPIIWGDMLFILTAVPADTTADPQASPSGLLRGQQPPSGPRQIQGETQGQEGRPQQKQRRGMQMNSTDLVHRFVVMAINRISGKVIWERTVKEERPQEGTHEFGSWASHSPVTDGEYLYAYFGSRGLFCLDFEGSVKWERDFGQLEKHMSFGEGSSPTLYKDKIIVTWDHSGDSFLYVLDKRTGRDIYKIARDEETSWASPKVIEVNGKPQVITSATKLVRSYDLDTGDLIWQTSGMTRNVIPNPLYQGGILYLMSGFRGNAILAIRVAGAQGDITDSENIIWKYDGRETPYTPSPVLVNERLYLLRQNNGYLSCFNAKTGEEIYSAQKLEGSGNIFASPLAAGGRLYIVGQQGAMYVVQEGPEFKILAKNKLEDNFIASPVVIGKTLYLRGYSNLYCIEE